MKLEKEKHMLNKEYIVSVQSGEGETLQVFGNSEPPTDADIEVCITQVKGGFVAFVDTAYRLAPNKKV